jgi:hypothetical protein
MSTERRPNRAGTEPVVVPVCVRSIAWLMASEITPSWSAIQPSSHTRPRPMHVVPHSHSSDGYFAGSDRFCASPAG